MNEFDRERKLYAKQHAIAEKQLKPIFRKAIIANMKPVVQWVADFGPNNVPIEKLIKTDVWLPAYLIAFDMIGQKFARQEYYSQRNIDGSETKASAIEFLKDAWSGVFRTYATEYIAKIASSLNQTTLDLITAALAEGEELGLDRNGFTRWFYKKANQIVADRTQAFTRTEATKISNLGKEIGARSWIDEQGGQGYKVWLGRIANERPEHLLLNNTIIPIDDLYDMSGHDCLRPGDKNLPANLVINCRCTQSLMSQNRYNAYLQRRRIVNGKLTGAS